jgi:Zn-dependent peptidase ImmA (M78 family)/DNA-binding XRE family transcriptional regulator
MMPVGVEGFVPGRLRMAREARALRQNVLADLVGKTPASVSKWESNENPQTPEPQTLGKLAEVLHVEADWFFKLLGRQTDTAVFYRSLKGELELLRNKADARLGFVEAIEEVLSDYVDLPSLDVPDLLEGREISTLRLEEIDGYAEGLRDHWDVPEGPIEDLMLLIENAGIVVAEDEIGSLKLDGVSRWSAATARPYMLLAKDKRVGVRRRLDAAHELGHIVLHRHLTRADLIRHFDIIEDQAMAFAGAFLLPERDFCDDIYSLSLDAMMRVKAKWRVSIGAMIKRLSNLGKFSAEYERRLWQYYSYRRWRGNEPLDDELPVESPESLREAVTVIVEGKAARPNQLRREIGLSAEDICVLIGLPTDYFEPRSANVVRLKPHIRSVGETEETTGDGTIVSFSGRKFSK